MQHTFVAAHQERKEEGGRDNAMAHGYGKTALITGASSGIGRELALVFAEHGYDLIVVARRKDKLEALATEIYDAYGAQVTVIPKDLSKPTAPKQLFKAVQDAGLYVDVLVNNAGFGSVKPFTDDAQTRLAEMVQVNVGALTALTRLFTQAMIDQGPDTHETIENGDGGKVLNVASVAAFAPTPGMALYGATKAFVLSLTEAPLLPPPRGWRFTGPLRHSCCRLPRPRFCPHPGDGALRGH